MADLSRNVHTYPTASVHTTDGLDCWCAPRYCAPCSQCDGDGCWHCEKGLVDLTRPEAETVGYPIVVVHHAVVEVAS